MVSEPFNIESNRHIKCFHDQNLTHMLPNGYALMSEYIFDCIKGNLVGMESMQPVSVPPFFSDTDNLNLPHEENLEKYLSFLRTEKVIVENIGAIVMNCNPFTYGHLYLIETALSQVDFLYVFVVEEDRSEFTFAERFRMVRENCRDFDRVRVLPSGKYMISRYTFGEYFSKDSLQDQKVYPANDVRIFGQVIAPCLGIKKRFVGEEPLDAVTRQYNKTMQDILPDYGVTLVEIPRKKDAKGKNYINATAVRKWLRNGEYDKCREYLPETTLRLIAQRNSFTLGRS